MGPSVAGGETAIARPLGNVAQALEQLQEGGCRGFRAQFRSS